MYSTEFRTTSSSSLTDVFIDGEWRGTFTSPRKAQFFVDGLTKHDIITNVRPPLVANQKNDEPPIKRRGRPKKVGNNDSNKFPSVRTSGS